MSDAAGAGPTSQLRLAGRLEHLRGSALGFRNLTNYIARSLLEVGGYTLEVKSAIARRLPDASRSARRLCG